MSHEVTLDHVREAARVLDGVAQHTPVDQASYLTGLLGVPTYMKLENLQRTGSFKLRGATYRLSRLTPEERARGVVAASAGNHAQGVAFAAQQLGVEATIFMPLGAPVPKLLATKGYGATVVTEGAIVDDCLALAQEHAERTGAVMIHPFDHPDVIAGQGTIGLEILDDVPDVETIVVPIGGGGLIAGIAVAAKARAALEGRTIRVIGVQAAATAAFPPSLAAGHPVTVERTPTIADGIAVARPGAHTFPIVRDLVDQVLTVGEDDLARAVLTLLERTKLVVEPAGAAPVAAILAGLIEASGPTVALVSGGNIDPLLLQRIVAHGLVASGRYMTLRIPLPDRPGQLAAVSELLARVGANVTEVLHTRHDLGLALNSVVLQVSVETRGPNHQQEVLDALTASGFTPEVAGD
ncbi:threonine ammonia-lyase [Demequina lignilytica]|uniref:L-threonine dehydratase catabolic TdcB n=1 Tax=Demequina lignilytica TaxID=3051663 RepID=A0AAW7MAF1_9MICO|nr:MULTISPECIES: threonine ammonia-lyase [unclassified Demequina]MDN4479090.1 threonine ammonia-lyase [Demequina sp. SYSU T00039-1]MDN4484391.1 threonine ammonia-lyase [Demequina sp. SYSU T0a273]MDN4488991.1 threonine ammonia-lyase [Demequina sp. SYSU T00039]MDN4491298.1 threonine ammonia-lyase [Demequina sp. SYSU T00068]